MIGDAVNSAILTSYEQSKPREYLGMSQMGYCVLKLWRQRHWQEKTELPRKALWKIQRGHAMHEFILAEMWKNRSYALEQFGIKYLKKEVECVLDILPDQSIVGHADFLCEIEGVRTVVDIKTVGALAKITGPRPHEKTQVDLYCEALKAQKGCLYYVDTETGNFKEFYWDAGTNDAAKEKAIVVFGTDEPVKPFDTPEESGWECSYCQYKEQCWGVTFIEKVDDSVQLDAEAEAELAEVDDELKELTKKREELRTELLSGLNGKTGVGAIFNATFSPDRTTISYAKDKLIKNVDQTILALCEEKKTTKGGYTLRRKGE